MDVAAADQDAHVVVGLDGDDLAEAADELPGQPSRSGAEVEHARLRTELERVGGAVEERSEVRRPDAVIRLGDVPEGEAERTRLVQLPPSTSGPRNG